MSELKPCPFCGGTNIKLGQVEISCPQEIGYYHHCDECNSSNEVIPYMDKAVAEWNTRPIEDALLARAEAAEKVIRGMFPMWAAAMGYCEHGRHGELMAMRNYYNGRDNPMTNEDIHVMFSLIPEKDGN